MRRLALAAAVLLAAVTLVGCGRQSPMEVKAQSFIEHLAKGDFALALTLMDKTWERNAAPGTEALARNSQIEDLQRRWKWSAPDNLGAFTRVKGTKHVRRKMRIAPGAPTVTLEYIDLTCEYERGEKLLRVMFDRQGQAIVAWTAPLSEEELKKLMR